MKQGLIPIGRARRRRLPFIASFGEAAMMQPPLLGSAFNDVLEFADDAARQIREALRSGPSALRSFAVRYPLAKRLNNQLQWTFARALVDASVERYDRLIEIVGALEPPQLFRLYSNEFTSAETARALLQLTMRVFTVKGSRV